MFEYYIAEEDIHFKYAKGEPSLKGREFHDYNELVFFIDGKSRLISKNIQQQLECGSIVIIPQEHFHQFCVTEPQNYVRCILGFGKKSELSELICNVLDTIKVISVPEERIVRVFENMIEIIKCDLGNKEKVLFIRSSLIQLLVYFRQNCGNVIEKGTSLSPTVSKALNIIDEKYNESLSVEDIANLLYISSSSLSHKFRSELNISVYQYISKKRLMEAHKLIKNGETLSRAAEKCGFSDYSCFYRLYKKYYKNIGA